MNDIENVGVKTIERNTSGSNLGGTDVKSKIGLLPLYLKLYDDSKLRNRERVDGFYKTITGEFLKRGLGVVTAPVCRIKDEFNNAIKKFEEEKAEAIVTLHLAYSPSLESIDALSSTDLPVIVCDTTPAYAYGPGQDPAELMYNHGIHGVQDMCNLLIRRGKPFHVEAGHWEKSDVIDRVVRLVKSAKIVSRFHRLKAGLIGEPFKGMGDFYVPQDKLKADFGIDTVVLKTSGIKVIADNISDADINKEIKRDWKRFIIENVNEEVHARTVRTQLAVEKWVSDENLGAFSFNFLDVTSDSGLETVPFLAASKLMADGIGYGGEGDLLTASLVGSLSSVFPETSFSEMFCPDWAQERIFLSHMGEFNYLLADGKARLFEMDYKFTDVENPVYAAGRFKPGNILIVNLLPLKDGYRLIIAPAEMVPVNGKDNMERSVHGWFKPKFKDGKIQDFLTEYSKNGGTHHLAIIYTKDLESVKKFGEMMGFDVMVIG